VFSPTLSISQQSESPDIIQCVGKAILDDSNDFGKAEFSHMFFVLINIFNVLKYVDIKNYF
jgi:hypothetical protein